MQTVLIRNTPLGCVWQVYHIQNYSEYEMLKKNSKKNGFMVCEMVAHNPSQEETFPDWREVAKLPLTGGEVVLKLFEFLSVDINFQVMILSVYTDGKILYVDKP